MLNVLNRYAMSRSFADAQKVRAYERKHPMAVTMLAPGYYDLLADAIAHANSGIDPRLAK